MTSRLRLAAAAALVAAPALAGAQEFTTLSQDAPAHVPDLASLAAGGTVAALPTLDSPFIANPAHITQSGLFSLNVVGLTAGAGGNLRESYTFYDEQLGPAIEEGLDEIRASDPERLEALYQDALRIGSQQKSADLAVLAPSVRASVGPAAVGVGVFGHSVTRAKIVDAGAGIPFIDLYSQADLFVPVVAGVDLSETPAGLALPFDLSVGASAAFVQRRVTAKSETVDAIDPDGEKLYVLRGSALRFGLGAYARNVGMPGIDLGAEVTSLGSAFDYDLDRSIELSGSDGTPDDLAEVAALEARFEGRSTGPAARLGAAYRLPMLLMPGLSDTAVALDYTTASTSEFDQSFQAGLRAGARATVAGVVGLQVGISQGMPSAGVALKTKVARIEYATYGVEDGRLLGQLPRRNHVLQVRFGWF